jgi:hypothetical protein
VANLLPAASLQEIRAVVHQLAVSPKAEVEAVLEAVAAALPLATRVALQAAILVEKTGETQEIAREVLPTAVLAALEEIEVLRL